MRLCPCRLTLDSERIPGNTVDVLFQGFGDLILYHVGIGTGIRAGDGNNRVIDRRVLAYTQVAVPNETKE